MISGTCLLEPHLRILVPSWDPKHAAKVVDREVTRQQLHLKRKTLSDILDGAHSTVHSRAHVQENWYEWTTSLGAWWESSSVLGYASSDGIVSPVLYWVQVQK